MKAAIDSYMMRLGDFQFSVSTAAFDRINTSSNYRWQSQQAPTNRSTPKLQFNGPGDNTMTIEGTIFPQMIKNGINQVDKMREQAAKGLPLMLCYVETVGQNSGVGRILGQWCITQINENRTLFLPDGNPREIHFTMQLTKYANHKA